MTAARNECRDQTLHTLLQRHTKPHGQTGLVDSKLVNEIRSEGLQAPHASCRASSRLGLPALPRQRIPRPPVGPDQYWQVMLAEWQTTLGPSMNYQGFIW